MCHRARRGLSKSAYTDWEENEAHTVIETSPTYMNAVYALMKGSIDTVDMIRGCSVDQPRPSVVVVCDQAVCAKAFEINNSPLHDKLERIVLRLGAFHIIINFMAIIERRFGSAGLRDVLIESDILATGSVDATLDGHHYTTGVRAH